MSGPHYFTDRNEWLAWRCVGGTTISAILGVNPWQSPLHAYLRLGGLINDDQDTLATGLGRHMQRHIAESWAENNDLTLDPRTDGLGEGPCYDHPDEPRFTVSLDERVSYLPSNITTDGPRRGLVEIKLTGNGSAWKDGPPAHVEAQARWQLGIVRANGQDINRCHIVCCTVPGWRLHEYHVDHDEELWQGMAKAAQAFLDNHVDAGVPPPACALDLDQLAAQAATDANPWHAADEAADELNTLAHDYAETADIIRTGEKLHKDQRARLLQLMGGHTDAWLSHDTDRKPLVTVRQQTRVTKCPACEHVLSDTTYPVLKVAI